MDDRRPTDPCPRGRRAAPAEDGFALIEGLVAGLLIVIASLGLYKGLDSADRFSGDNRLRTMAASLAHADQERMRAYAASDLSNYRASRTATSAGKTYTITSRAQWVSDGSGTASCTAGDTQASYQKITSTVTWPGMVTDPVEVTSLVAPTNGSFNENQGSLGIQVLDAAGEPAAGKTVSISGNGTTLTDTTNEQGCVLWGYLNEGNHTVTCGGASDADPTGTQPPTYLVGVVAEAVSNFTCQIATPGTINVTYTTNPYRLIGGASTLRATRGEEVTFAHPNLPTPGFRRFGTSDTYTTSLSAPRMFPFASGYVAYAGNCSANLPPVANQQTVTLAEGGTTNVAIHLPSINIRVTRNGSNYNNARVRVVDKSAADCTSRRIMKTNSSGRVTHLYSTGSTVDNGLPYGTYEVCVSDGTRFVQLNSVPNTDPTGQPVRVMAIPTTNGTGNVNVGNCP